MAADEDWQFYRLWIEDVAKLREARRQTTAFFVSLNLAAFGALGFVLSHQDMPNFFVVAAVPAIWLVNLSWLATDNWFARLTWRKLAFLREVEASLSRAPITQEVKGGEPGRSIGWWLVMERVLPVLFSVGFTLAASLTLPWMMPFPAPIWWQMLLQR